MKKETKLQPTSVKVNGDILSKVKEYCEKNGIKIGFFYDKAAEEKLEREIIKSKQYE